MSRNALKSSVTPNEKGTLTARGNFTDSTKKLVTPNSAIWSLTDKDGNFINERQDIPIVGFSTSYLVTMTKNDLAVPDASDLKRYFLITYNYDSDEGSDLQENEEIEFSIKNLKSVQ